jgi:hypothetical protein
MGACGATAENVKLLLPPRQSRGISHVSLDRMNARGDPDPLDIISEIPTPDRSRGQALRRHMGQAVA